MHKNISHRPLWPIRYDNAENKVHVLTYYCEIDEMTEFWCGTDLTLVFAGIGSFHRPESGKSKLLRVMTFHHLVIDTGLMAMVYPVGGLMTQWPDRTVESPLWVMVLDPRAR